MSNPRKEKTIPVDIQEKTYEGLSAKAEEKGISIRKYVNELLAMMEQKETFREKLFPKIKLYSVGATSIFLKDCSDKDSKTAEIMLLGDKMYCTLDDSNDCIHVHYALSIPEIGILVPEEKGKDKGSGLMNQLAPLAL